MISKSIDSNTRKEWTTLKKELEKELFNNQISIEDKITIFVNVYDNVESLAYFFPIADMLRNHVEAIELNVQIRDSYDFERVHNQVGHFLCLQQIYADNVTIKINGSNKPNQTNFGRIQPLVAVNQVPASPFEYRKALSMDIDMSVLFHLQEYIIKDLFEDERLSEKDWTDIQNIVYTIVGMNTDKFVKDENNKKYFSSEESEHLKWDTLFYIEPNDNISLIYAKFALSNLYYAIENLKGTREAKLSKRMKAYIAEQFFFNYQELSKNLTVLTQYIWSVLLRFLFDSKELVRNKKEDDRSYYRSLFDISLNQAEALSDGLFQLIENACLHSKSHSGYFFLRVHKTGFVNLVQTKNAKGSSHYEKMVHRVLRLEKLSKAYPRYKLDSDIMYYLEICFLDNAFDQDGIIGIKDQFEDMQKVSVSGLMDIFRYRPLNKQDLLIHYGLRVFERTVIMNNGAFFVTTPSREENIEGYFYRSVVGTPADELAITDRPCYGGTIYNVLLPIQNKWIMQQKKSNQEPHELFDLSCLLENILPLWIDVHITPEIELKSQKTEKIDLISQEMELQLHDVSTDDRIICIYPANFGMEHIELLVKAVVSLLLKRSDQKNRIAILLSNKNQILEFTRVYTAFFDISGACYDRFLLSDTQIALCRTRTFHSDSDSEEDENECEVCFVLSGNHIVAAQDSVRNYLYYHSEASMEFLPLINYLTAFIDEETDGEAHPLFPFDLYLDLERFDSYNNEKTSLSEDNIWFFRRIMRLLNTDIQVHGEGCKLSNVHVSIGSKIHIDTFYNAELLFHNYANVFRFAYIIARAVIGEHRKSFSPEKKIVMVAYGEYSLIMIQKVCDIIQKVTGAEADYILFPSYLNEDDMHDWRSHGKEILPFLEKEKIKNKNNIDDYIFYVVVPISTTLSTVQKIHDVIKRKCLLEGIKNTPNFGLNSSLIVVGGLKGHRGVALNYWKECDESRKIIVLHDVTGMLEPLLAKQVRYYFNTSGGWFKASSPIKEREKCCMMCRTVSTSPQKSLIGVDKTSTLPNVIFDSLDTEKQTFILTGAKKTKNDEYISRLYGYVTYSHIAHNKNHFLYDIDYENFSKNPDVSASVVDWLKNHVRNQIDINAFNIIVSPLNAANSVFLKNVIENAFDNNGRVVNIKFHTSYRDEIRSKLEYISNEYNTLKKTVSGSKVNVYFVDNCIIEGSTFHRSRQFMYMLLSNSGFDMETVSLFKGIILLSNRSSYDTIQNLLPGHVEDGFFYYMRLNVPSYNMKNGICPSCAISSQYLLMRKRASTSVISTEYDRLYKKHIQKTKSEYLKWQNIQLWRSTYLERFLSWLYYSVYRDDKTKKYFYVDITGSAHPLLDENGCMRSLTVDELEKIFVDKGELDRLLDDNYRGKSFMEERAYVQKKIIAYDKNYIRMLCTHNIFMLHEQIHREAVQKRLSAEEYEKLIREKLLGLIKDSCNSVSKKKLDKKVTMWLKSEWIISYIKMMSRKQPAQYYQLRNAIYNIMLDLLECFLTGSKKADLKFLTDICAVDARKKDTNSIMPDMKFKIFLVIVRRLSAMHSLYLTDHLDEIVSYYYECRNQYEGNGKHKNFYSSETERNIYRNIVHFPDVKYLNFSLSRLIKWSSVYGMDDSKCYTVENVLTEALKKYEKLNDIEKKEAFEFSETLDTRQIAFLENTQVIYHGIRKLRLYCPNNLFCSPENIYNYVKEIIENSNNQLYEMSPYKSLLDFIHIPFNDAKKERKAMCKRISNMLMLFYTLCEIEARETPVTSPYDYVSICNYIRNIMRYNKCEIVSVKEHKITTIASSDVYSPYLLNGDLSDEVIDDAINEFNRNTQKSLMNKVAQKFVVGDKVGMIIIPLLCWETDDSVNHVPNFYMVLYKGDISGVDICSQMMTHQDLWDLRNVMFLRDRLEINLKKDMAYLRDMVSSYGYIKPLGRDRRPVVLHISDIHVHTNPEEDTKIRKGTSDAIANEKNFAEIKPDLLLITGDVITGDYTAAGLIRSYEKAANLIKNLVVKLWGKKDGDDIYVESDWKKRILISTGNHDYASMNELKAHNSRRTTTSGTPGALGDNMVKHSYFVNFVHNLLGNEIDEIVKYDINRIVNYKELGISVVNLNSNSDVNPLRTNKVRVNSVEVDSMFSHNSVENTMVYMMHHTPMYDIDYIDDIYYLTPRMFESVKETVRGFGLRGLEYTEYNQVNDLWIKLIKSLVRNFENDVYDQTAITQKRMMKDIIRIIKDKHYKEYDDKNLAEFEYFIDCENPDIDDKCRHILSNLNEQLLATKKDTDEFANFIYNHFKTITLPDKGTERIYYILGGHTHIAARSNIKMDKVMSNCLGIFEAGKFLTINESNVKLSYFYLSIDNDRDAIESGKKDPLLASGYEKAKLKDYTDSNCRMLGRIINEMNNSSETDSV